MKYTSLLLALATLASTTNALGQTNSALPQAYDDLSAAVRSKTADSALQSALARLGFTEPDYDEDGKTWDVYLKAGPDCDPKSDPMYVSTLGPSEYRCVFVDVIHNKRGPVQAILWQWGAGFHPESYGIVPAPGKGSPVLATGKNPKDFQAHKLDGLKSLLDKFETDLAAAPEKAK